VGGLPDKGGEFFAELTYDKGSKWNTYFEVSYKLPEKLRGVQKLQFVFRQKVHVKGFQFKCKTFDTIPFAACDEIYGDSFEKTDRAVEKIGNNVTISFAEMNFYTPATHLELKWRSRLESNTIKMLFEGENGETSNMLSLPASAEFSTRTLALENHLTGKGTVRFVFLPGSEIDLECFEFSYHYPAKKLK
jgi:beta-galactosidase